MYTKLDNVVNQSILEYPTLFEGRDRVISRLAVLNHLFLVIGNGWGWTKDGYMADEEENNDVELVWRDSHWWADVAPAYNPDESTIKLDEGLFKDTAGFHASWRQSKGFTPYPAFTGGALNRVPGNVQSDWLDGAIEITQATLDWYSNCNNLDMYMKHGDPANIRLENVLWLSETIDKLQALRQKRINQEEPQGG